MSSCRELTRCFAGNVVGLVLWVLGGAATLHAATVSNLLPPAGVQRTGAEVVIEWVTLNPGSDDATFSAPRVLPARLSQGGRAWAVTLQSDGTPPAVIGPGRFAHREYRFTLPADAVGLLVLEASVVGGSPLRTVVEVRDTGTGDGEPEQDVVSTLAAPLPASSAITRTFAGRLAPHEPVYFIYGPDNPAAKFQFSFKYRLLTFREDFSGFWPETLHFAFTQRSLWDIAEDSSPFYDTSYMPELVIQSDAPLRGQQSGWFSFLGYQMGLRHESNGRSAEVSRSLNQGFIRPVFAVGPLDGWHLLILPELFTYVGGLSDNPELDDYRGYGQLRLLLGKNDGPSLMFTGWAGQDLEHRSMQIDVTVPIRTRVLNFQTYLLFQYFDGYGESLLSYDEPTEVWRAGLSFVR